MWNRPKTKSFSHFRFYRFGTNEKPETDLPYMVRFSVPHLASNRVGPVPEPNSCLDFSEMKWLLHVIYWILFQIKGTKCPHQTLVQNGSKFWFFLNLGMSSGGKFTRAQKEYFDRKRNYLNFHWTCTKLQDIQVLCYRA